MPERPNILLITCDQLRHDFLGYTGAQFAKTPNLDKLARSGMSFTQCCTDSPVCSPARMALATGIHPLRSGWLNNHFSLPLEIPNYYRALRNGGYHVGCVGKLDLDKPALNCGRNGDLPRTYSWGFTHPVEIMGRMDTVQREGPGDPYTFWLEEQGKYDTYMQDLRDCKGKEWLENQLHDSYLPEEFWQDAYIGRRAEDWIQQRSTETPWHLFLSFTGPHDPFNPPASYSGQFDKDDMPPPIKADMEGKPEWIKNRASKLTWDEDLALRTRRNYSGCIYGIDQAVKRVVDVLEQKGFLDNTIIIFSSDHGEMAFDHGLMCKSAAYETSLRVPLFITGPGIPQGESSEALIQLMDVGRTIVDLAGCEVEEEQDAVSFLPVLQQKQNEHRGACVAAEKKGANDFACVRTRRYKYIRNHGDLDELYDLENDPQELRNLADEKPYMVEDLQKHLKALEAKKLKLAD